MLKVKNKEVGKTILNELLSRRNELRAVHSARFFKTAPGQYGQGDMFLGISVPDTRSVVKTCAGEASLTDVAILISSPWHEARLAGFLILLELYRAARKSGREVEKETLIRYYLDNIDRGNNWDLVDLIAPGILGLWVAENTERENVIMELAAPDNSLWKRRVAIVATLPLIKQGRFETTLKVAHTMLTSTHDLLHKATGWMLREVGKHGGLDVLREFLNRHKNIMPRTMLRYAIERLQPDERRRFMDRDN